MSHTPPVLSEHLLVHTKLRRPRTVGQIVSRPRLFDELRRGMALPLTIVSAPPGYGKTTLVGLWLAEGSMPWAWYSVDEHDNTLDTFAAYLAGAITGAYADCGATLRAVLQSPTLPQAERLADIFIGELAALPGPLLLVLDDYHVITNPEIHDFMASVIRNAPEGVHFALLVRADPPLKLARLRARQQVHEVRAAQLRFTPDEARELMQRIMGDLATEETVALFAERTEGWPAGIHLAATSMRDSENAATFVSGFARSSSQAVADFLVTEVLENLAAEERDLLLRTSILPRFCAPLCDAMIARPENKLTGAAFIQRLRSMNLFLVALDEEGTWYRFHHLFADILRRHLRQVFDEGEIGGLYGAASRWFEAHGLLDEAITHGLEAGDPLRAPRLVEAYADSLLNGETWRTLERWLALLPPPQKRRPALLAALGWVEQFRYRPGSILNLVEEAEAGLARNDEQYTPAEVEAIQAALLTLRAVANSYLGRWELAQRQAEQALPALAPGRVFARGICEFIYLRSTSHLGRPYTALEQAESWLRTYEGRPDAHSLRLQLTVCSVYYDLMQLDELRAAATSFRQMALAAQRPVSVAWATYLLGYIHYQQNEPVLAHAYFSQIVQYPHEAHTRAVVDAWIGLCLSLEAQGMHKDASTEVEELRTFLLQGGQVDLTQIADALADYLDLRAGHAVRVRDSYVQDPVAQLGRDFALMPLLVWGLGGIRSGVRAQQTAVAAQLEGYHTLLAADFSPRRVLEADLLEALLYAAQENHKGALDALRRAVALAEQGGALRCFVDMGADLKPYLYQLADAGVATAYIARIIDAYAPQPQGAGAVAASPAVTQDDASTVSGPDRLSNRELDVLLLLERRLSNKEIGELLFISPRTVKRHTISIYSKLRVDNRRAAVARAKALGLMPHN
jgi:LuxR family maltose regulon positive regulatory protein